MLQQSRWLLALVAIIAATLACDAPSYDPLMVCTVQADGEQPGRVLARICNIETSQTYESVDFGQTWQRTEETLDPELTPEYPLSIADEVLRLNDRPLWQFPRPVFRWFFFQDDYGQYFRLPLQPANSAHEDVLYAAMGTEGVLTIHDYLLPGWERAALSAEGIDLLDPLQLTITEPETIARVVLLALLVPPLPLVHAYLFTRLWAYIMPVRLAAYRALAMSLGLAVLAVVAIIVWLTNAQTDYPLIVALMTLITVLVSTVTTWAWMRQRALSSYTRRRLLVSALLLSLVVPAGVAAVWGAWWLILGLIVGYAIFQWVYYRQFSRADLFEPPLQSAVRWQLDRLSLQSVLVSALVLIMAAVLFSFGAGILQQLVPGQWVWDAAVPAGLLAGVVGSVWVIYGLYRGQRDRLAEKMAPPLKFAPRTGLSWVAGGTIAALAAAGMLAFGVFSGQAMAYGWFSTLLKP